MSVTLTIENQVARITIDRPQALNAIDEASERALQGIWTRLEGERDVRAIVLPGGGERAFCAGADMKSGKSSFSYGAPRPGGFGGIALRHARIPVIRVGPRLVAA
jgi:crotonobetainyl-CoA hydratase